MCESTDEGPDSGPVAEDWTQLKDNWVLIMREGALVDGGRVDTVTADGSVLWLAMEGFASRRIIEKMPEVDILVATAAEQERGLVGSPMRLRLLNTGP